MANDLSGFSYNGQHSSSFGLYVVAKPPLLPQTRDIEEAIPGRHGVWDFGSTLDKRLINVDCFLVCDNREDLIVKIRQVADWLNPLRGYKRLVFDEFVDRYFLAKYSGQMDLEYFVTTGKFTIPFKCCDPFAYSQTTSNELKSVTTSGETFDIPRDLNALPVSPIITITNKGATPVSNIRIKRTQIK